MPPSRGSVEFTRGSRTAIVLRCTSLPPFWSPSVRVARNAHEMRKGNIFKAITSGCDGGRHGREEGSASLDKAMKVGAEVKG